jgi:hypothetical protein
VCNLIYMGRTCRATPPRIIAPRLRAHVPFQVVCMSMLWYHSYNTHLPRASTHRTAHASVSPCCSNLLPASHHRFHRPQAQCGEYHHTKRERPASSIRCPLSPLTTPDTRVARGGRDQSRADALHSATSQRHVRSMERVYCSPAPPHYARPADVSR